MRADGRIIPCLMCGRPECGCGPEYRSATITIDTVWIGGREYPLTADGAFVPTYEGRLRVIEESMKALPPGMGEMVFVDDAKRELRRSLERSGALKRGAAGKQQLQAQQRARRKAAGN